MIRVRRSIGGARAGRPIDARGRALRARKTRRRQALIAAAMTWGAYACIASPGGAGDADAYAGGAGHDTVSYADRTGDLWVDLDQWPDDGVSGEGDNVEEDVEEVWGGSGNDRLSGGPGGSVLVGGPGADVL